MLFHFRFTFVLVVILLVISSCSKDDNPIAPSQTPSVSIVVETPNPSIGEPVVFKAQYTGAPLAHPSFTWNFGDNTPTVNTSADTVSHSFYSGGQFTVTVHLVDSSTNIDVRDSIIVQITDGRSVHVVALTASPEVGAPVQFKAEYTGPALDAPSFEWDFGDGTPTVTRNADTVSHSFAESREYTVRMRLEDASTNTVMRDSLTIQPTTARTASIVLLTTNPEAGAPVQFKAEHNGAILFAPTYEWDFGDGSQHEFISTPVVSHTYKTKGTFSVTLRLSDLSISFPLIATTDIVVTENKPVWRQWNWIDVTIHVKGRFNLHYYNNSFPNGIDSVFYDSDRFVIETFMDSFKRTGWNGNVFSFEAMQSAGSGMSGFSHDVKFIAVLSPDGLMIDSLYTHDDSGAFNAGVFNLEKNVRLIAKHIPISSAMGSDCHYRLEGVKDFGSILSLGYSAHDERYIRGSYYSLLSTEPTSDMYIDVHFYRK